MSHDYDLAWIGTVHPHKGGCPGCRELHICNGCGQGLIGHKRCTNGRCLKCHETACTPGGNSSEGHGYGDHKKLAKKR